MKKNIRNIAILVIICIIVSTIAVASIHRKDIGECIEYKCDVKNLRLSTTIEIDKEGERFAKVSGNIFRFVTDPLTMYDENNNQVAYANDTYHLVAQDSHSIYVEDARTAEMVGQFKVLGEKYDIYNKDGDKIATVTFNAFNTNGKMYDTDGNLIADYNSIFFFNDFDVRIKENCKIEERTVLMIFCSYYSDQKADSSSKESG